MTAIAELPDDEQALNAFSSMRQVLRDGGILILDQRTTDKQWIEKPRFMLAADTLEVSRLFVIDYLRERRARYNLVDILHGDDGGGIKTWSIDLRILLPVGRFV